ncbi:hypothetical protein [Dokdonella sp.]|uniref:hypothetical protein n=1 Tax=Dokdonella sp. TaxID=2291710 RepID=UPI0025BFBC13|nr:hypothetical protein [Dokdonella sp.]MBX3692593.1 hypothetical protein [Dokdonella sp.]MCW5568674.1 hypothetical protein [Dokdonella sp.]
MRFAIVLAIGILVGAICAMTAATILGQRHAYPKALMRVLKTQLGDARTAALDAGCAGNERRLAILVSLGGDIAHAIPHGDPPDRVFARYVDELQQATIAARDGAADCKAQGEALTRAANACESCHRDYR